MSNKFTHIVVEFTEADMALSILQSSQLLKGLENHYKTCVEGYRIKEDKKLDITSSDLEEYFKERQTQNRKTIPTAYVVFNVSNTQPFAAGVFWILSQVGLSHKLISRIKQTSPDIHHLIISC